MTQVSLNNENKQENRTNKLFHFECIASVNTCGNIQKTS